MRIAAGNYKQSISSVFRRGFTLVELLAVVAVMLIVLKLTLPSLDGLLGSDAQAMARTQLIGDLNKARSMALEKGVPVYVVFMPLYSGVGDRKGNKNNYFVNKDINVLLDSQLTGYAIYAPRLPGDQPNNPTPKWLSDWKKLPSGYHFGPDTLWALSERVWVPNLKGQGSMAQVVDPRSGKKVLTTLQLGLPAIKYNSRGGLEGAGLKGVYLSVNEGGVFPPDKKFLNGNEVFNTVDADPPETVPNEARQWLHINAITGRAEIEELSEEQAEAGADLSKRLDSANSRYNIFIFSAPEWPANFSNRIPKFNGYNPAWCGAPPWSPLKGNYAIKPNNSGKLVPVFQGVPSMKDALQLKWALESAAATVGTGVIGVRIESIQ